MNLIKTFTCTKSRTLQRKYNAIISPICREMNVDLSSSGGSGSDETTLQCQ